MEVATHELQVLEGDEPPVISSRFPSFKEARDAYEREFMKRTLSEADGNVSRAAELMDMDRSHFYRRMRALGINVRDERGGA